MSARQGTDERGRREARGHKTHCALRVAAFTSCSGRNANLYDPCASALRAGLRISLHSDWNVTPLEPLRYVEDAVTRIMTENDDVLNPDERIPIEAALRAVTLDAA